MESFGNKILQYQDAIIKDLATLVAIPSVRGEAAPGQPFGEEPARALASILGMGVRMGLAVKNVENYAGHAEIGAGDGLAAVLSHLDVVPVGDGWIGSPFLLAERGGCLYGRGTADDKAAAIISLYCLKILRDENVPAKRRLRAIFGTAEETGSEDMAYYFAKEPRPDMGFTPDAEYGVCNREKGGLHVRFTAPNAAAALVSLRAGVAGNAVPGRAEAVLLCPPMKIEALKATAKEWKGRFEFIRTERGVRVVSFGTAAHAMQPEMGFNALTHLLALLAEVFGQELGALPVFLNKFIGTELDGESMGVKCEDEESGPLTLSLNLMEADAEGVSADVDIRYPVTKLGSALGEIIIKKAEGTGVKAALASDSAPLYLPAESPLIALLQGAYKEIMGKECGLYSTGGGTYARSMAGKGVAFGLFFADEPDRRLHNSNEHVEISRMMQHAQVCLEAMYRMMIAE